MIGDEPNHFEALRDLVSKHMPVSLERFDAVAHRLKAHQDDELFLLIESAGLSAILAGKEVEASNQAHLKALENISGVRHEIEIKKNQREIQAAYDHLILVIQQVKAFRAGAVVSIFITGFGIGAVICKFWF